MTDEAIDGVMQFIFDVSRRIDMRIAACREDLNSNDEAVQKAAADEMMRWLEYMPPHDDVKDRDDPNSAAGSSTPKAHKAYRKRGRPRVKGYRWIHGLSLYLLKPKTWREIAEEAGEPCCHLCPTCHDTRRPLEGPVDKIRRPRCPKCHSSIRPAKQRESVCDPCMNAMRDGVIRLRKLLMDRNILPTGVRIIDLRRMSPDEVERAWPEHIG